MTDLNRNPVIRHTLRRYPCLLVLGILIANPVASEERRTHSVKLETGGRVEIEVPESWGSEPDVERGETLTLLRFEPVGTRRNPIFAISIVVAVPDEPTDAAAVRAVAERIREEFRESALEEEIPITDLAGEKNMISYFTLTDKEIKPREYQYLTSAVVSDGKMVASLYFFSNDGAPDYGTDAMHLMETMRYIPPEG